MVTRKTGGVPTARPPSGVPAGSQAVRTGLSQTKAGVPTPKMTAIPIKKTGDSGGNKE